MPTFPSFQRRLAQFNNPMQRTAAETPMQVGGGIPRPRNLVSPMQRQPQRTLPPGVGELGPDDVQPMRGQLAMDTSMIRPNSAAGGEIPLVQPSGTEPDPQTNKPSTGLIQRKVAQDAGIDLSPRMEEIPSTPGFEPKEVKGVWGRIKSAFQAAGGASRMYPDRALAPLVGAVAGAIDPRIAQVMHYQGVVLPQAFQQQQQVMARNDARQKSYGLELQNRERLAKIQEMNQPDYASLAGGEYPLLYNKKDPTQSYIPKGPDGQPLRNASVRNTEDRNETLEEIARMKAMHAAEMAKQKAETDLVKAQRADDKARFDRDLKLKIAEMNEAGRNRRTGITQAGATARNNARIKARRGDDGDDDDSGGESKKPRLDSPFGFRPTTSGTSAKKGKRQLPPQE